MADHAGLSMHRQWGTDGFAAEGFIDALHAQTDTEYRHPGIECFNECRRNARMDRIPGTGADEHIVRFELFDPINGYLIAPVNEDIQVIFHEHLNEVVGERIVVIDDKERCQDISPLLYIVPERKVMFRQIRISKLEIRNKFEYQITK